MNNLLLHISDLHVSLEKDFDGKDIKTDSYLLAVENDQSSLFIERFNDFCKGEINESHVFLLVTGDITNRGEKIEFDFALKYLEKIISDLKIDKKNILLIPGDHDLNRRDIESLLANNSTSSIEEINNAKFNNFKKFYSDLLGKEFDANRIIIDNLIIDDRIQLIGINSAYKIDLQQKEGAISIEMFIDELKDIQNDKSLKQIFCCHHNILSSFENKKSGQWQIDNRSRLLAKLQEKSINFIFSGNEHTSSLEKYGQGEITVSDSGALTSINYDSAFKIYSLNYDSDDIILTNQIYALQKTGAFERSYYWEKRTNSYCRQDELLNIFIKETPNIKEGIIELLDEKDNTLTPSLDIIDGNLINNSKDIYYNSTYTDVLYNKVKDLGIFHTGHFHWSETSRAHNWIDVSKLIENKENLSFLHDALINIIETKIAKVNVDLVIGLGYEGNILATKPAIKYNKPYSFLPYSYRHHEHHDFENSLNFDNAEDEYKSVLIITDVVNDGRTIRKLIKKREKEFFARVQKIYVISLFYTGGSDMNNNILNFEHIKTIKNYDLSTDEEVNNIDFYTVKSLKVEKCPYGKDFREECFIYKDELNCVNLFYDEKKYISLLK